MNTRTKHTPGPWTRSNHIIGTAEGVICRMASSEGCAGIGRNHTVQTQEANAELIADAPAMLQALIDLYKHCALVHKRWGADDNKKEANAAIKAGATLIIKHTAHATTTADVEQLSATLRSQPPADPCVGCRRPGVTNCLTCIDKKEPRT